MAATPFVAPTSAPVAMVCLPHPDPSRIFHVNKRHQFRPESLGALEPRLVLSGSAATMVASAPTVQAQATTPKATLPADRATTTFEINFLTGMIPHHQMAIDMSRLALRQATDTQVKGLARRIIAEQTPEIARMNRYLAVDGVRNFKPGKAPDEVQDLKQLRSQRGVAFDRAFLTMMTEHHMMAIQGDGMGMVGAAEAKTRAAQPGIRVLAGNIVATQTREIAEMQGFLTRLRGSTMA